MNTLDRTQVRVSVGDRGEEMVCASGLPMPRTTSRSPRGLNREVWFDNNNTLVRVQLAAKDGSTLVYHLR